MEDSIKEPRKKQPWGDKERERQRAWYARNKEALRAKAKARRDRQKARDPEAWAAAQKVRDARCWANRDEESRQKTYDRQKRYKDERPEYRKRLARQETERKKRKLAEDPEGMRAKGRRYVKAYRLRMIEAGRGRELGRRSLFSKYKITQADYDRMVAEQDNKCAICGGPPLPVGKSKEPVFCIDHCHETGVVRALLCTNCNLMIGHAQEDVSRLLAGANYVKRWNERKSENKKEQGPGNPGPCSDPLMPS